MRQASDGAVYVRQQQGHSLFKHAMWGICVCWINVLYISLSPNHYWRF